MRDILIALVCLYFGVQNVRSLAAIPLAEWQLVQWLLAAVTVVMFALGIYELVRVARAMLVAQKRAKAEADRIRAEAAAEAGGPDQDAEDE